MHALPSPRLHRKRGRPVAKVRSVIVGTWLPEDEADRLMKIAREKDRSVSSLSRQLLQLGLKQFSAGCVLLAAALVTSCATRQAAPPIVVAPQPITIALRGGAATVPPSTPFKIAGDHDGAGGVTEYRLIINNQVAQVKPRSALVANLITFDVSGWPPGSYQVALQSVAVATADTPCVKNGGTVDACSGYGPADPIVVTVNAAPKFQLGDRVEAWKCGTAAECATIGDGALARDAPSMSGAALASYPPGSPGTVTQNAQEADGYRWWFITYDGTGPDGWSTETNLIASTKPPPDAAKDCVGTWSDWTCGAWQPDPPPPGTTAQTRTCTRAFTAEPGTPAGGGQPCPPSPETKTETRPITPAGQAPAPAMTACRWTLRAEPPDTTTGWRAQWRQGGIPVGKPDPTRPVDRVVAVSGPATIRVDVEWTKSGGAPPILSAPRDLVCQ